MFSFKLCACLSLVLFFISCEEGAATINTPVRKHKELKEKLRLRKIASSKEVLATPSKLRGKVTEEEFVSEEILYANYFHYAYTNWNGVPTFSTKFNEILQNGCKDTNPLLVFTIQYCFTATEEDDGLNGFVSYRYVSETEDRLRIQQVFHRDATSCSVETAEVQSTYDIDKVPFDCVIEEDELERMVISRNKFNGEDFFVKPTTLVPVNNYLTNIDCTGDVDVFEWFNVDDNICIPEADFNPDLGLSLTVYEYRRNTVLGFAYSLSNEQCNGDTIASEVIARRGKCEINDDIKDDVYSWNIIDSPFEVNPKTGAKGYAKCGGKNFDGPTFCIVGWKCVKSDDYYSQCIPEPPKSGEVGLYGQCDGQGFISAKSCAAGSTCEGNENYKQCIPTNVP